MIDWKKITVALLTVILLPLVACQAPTENHAHDAGSEDIPGLGPAATFERTDEVGADLVVLNGKIVTMADGQPEVEALAATGGRIVALGTQADVAAQIGEQTEVVDLRGRLAIPGFIEAHAHFMGLGDSLIQLDLRQANNWDDIVAMVEKAAADAAPGDWIRGRGWHQDKWSAAPEPNVEGFPLHESLSAVSPDNPVLLTHASGHASFVNAKALEMAGIDDSTADMEGGEILRDANGKATGLLRERAAGLVSRLREVPPESEQRRMAELASRESLQNGITSFQDAGSSYDTIAFLKQLAEEGGLGVRLWMMIRASEEEHREKLAATLTKEHANGMFAVSGIKISLDGALGSRGAWLLEPYTDSPDSTGLNTASLEYTRNVAQLAIDHGYQLCIHAIGDRANREVLDIYEETFKANPDATDLRWRVEHAQHLHPDDIPRFGELDVIASMQGVHCTSDGPWVPDRLGDQRTEEGAYVWQKLLQSGAVIINGTDAPVEDISPIASYYSSVSRRLPDGSIFYGDQRMQRLEALKTYTIAAAYGVFQEDEKGSLEVGKLADITVLSQDILTVAEEEIPKTEIVKTILGGEVVYSGEG